MIALLLVLPLCGCGSSDQNDVKRYALDDLSYEVPASWLYEAAENYQYSDDDKAVVNAFKYEAGSASVGKMYDSLKEDGTEYVASDHALSDGQVARGAVYQTDDGMTCAVFSMYASNSDFFAIKKAPRDGARGMGIGVTAVP